MIKIQVHFYSFDYFNEDGMSKFTVHKNGNLFYLLWIVDGEVLQIGHTANFSSLVKCIRKYCEFPDWAYMALRSWSKSV